MQAINIYTERGYSQRSAYNKVVGMLFGLTSQEVRVLTEMVELSTTDPAANRRQARLNSKVKSAEGFNNIFSSLKKKGIIVQGDTTKYAYASGIVLSEGISSIQINFIPDVNREEEDN